VGLLKIFIHRRLKRDMNVLNSIHRRYLQIYTLAYRSSQDFIQDEILSKSRQELGSRSEGCRTMVEVVQVVVVVYLRSGPTA
jgi:hypothetical protein